MKATLLIENIGELATPQGSSPRFGSHMSRISVIKDAAILVDIEKIVWAGKQTDLPHLDGPPPEIFDAMGQSVIPGFVDSHTHFVFAGYRDEEFYWRASGMPYMDIHTRGGA